MLSVGKVATATRYYEQTDDYYTSDRAPSAWAGEGAAALGLSGEVDSEQFQSLLEGKMPDGTKIHVGGGARRGGTDLTFSMPKSVSIEALVNGDARLLAAHDQAVASVTSFVESRAATRSGEVTGKLVMATFRHERSREGDPQGHTHVVVLNATQDKTGKWRAIDHRPFYLDKMMLGAMYRAELAANVRKLGYEVRVTHGDGRFELAHVSDAQIEQFSKRSRQIEAQLARRGLDRETASGAQKAVAATSTRQRKGSVDLQALRTHWKEEARAVGIDPEFHQRLAVDKSDSAVRHAELGASAQKPASAVEAVDYAIAHTTERQGTVRERDLLRHAMEFGTGKVAPKEVLAEVGRRVKDLELEKNAQQYAGTGDVRREEAMLAAMAEGKGATAPIAPARTVAARLRKTALNAGQREAAALILTSKDQVVGVQGKAGTGKTTMLKEVHAVAQAGGRGLHGLGPSGRAVREMEGAGVGSRTIASFLRDEKAKQALGTKDVLVVDEAGMVSARQMHAILAVAKQAGAKVVLIGDTRQLKSVEAGRPFEQLQQRGMATARMDQIQRQKDPELRQAVESLSKGATGAALAQLKSRVTEIRDEASRHAAIARAFVAVPEGERDRTLVITGRNASREALNTAIRRELGQEGKGVSFATLRSVDMTGAQAKRAVMYQAGMVVEAQREYRSLGVARGEQLSVRSVKGGQVTLARVDGRELRWSPARQNGFKAYEAVEREMAVGDRVQFTVGDRALGVKNRDLGTVERAERGQLQVRLDSGARVTLGADRRHHIDHGYAATTYGSQGATVDRALIDIETRSQASNQNAAYVQVSRARMDVQIYTDDEAKLPKAFARQVEKTAALDVRAHEGEETHSASPPHASERTQDANADRPSEPKVLERIAERARVLAQVALERLTGRGRDVQTDTAKQIDISPERPADRSHGYGR